jgi:hypothetical protein
MAAVALKPTSVNFVNLNPLLFSSSPTPLAPIVDIQRNFFYSQGSPRLPGPQTVSCHVQALSITASLRNL